MAGKLRLGLFGGSFDPVHCGHIQLAVSAQKQFHLDKVLFIPARKPPHKKDKTLTPASQRLRMLALALRPYARFEVSRYELRRRATTYTYQTVGYFRRRYPDAKIFFIIGSDSLAELPAWKNARHLFSLCEFIVGKRQAATDSAAPGQPIVHFLSRRLPAVSSSAVRAKVRSGHAIRRLVPRDVEHYIAHTKLYTAEQA